MKRAHHWFCRLACAGCIAFALACSEPSPPSRIVAEVVDLKAVDADAETATYEIAPRELPTLRDLNDLDGEHIRIRRGGKLIIRQITGSYVSSGEFEAWSKPALRYDVHGGVIVPRDYPTLAMLSAYRQYERIFAELPRVMGDSIDSLAPAGGFLALFEPAIVLRGAESASVSIRGNAAYLGGKNQFALFERSNIEHVPLATNLLVLAHEFGHWVFDTAFLRSDEGECDDAQSADNAGAKLFPGRLSVEYAIAGINEGFADFFSFAVTGATNPLFDLEIAERSIRSTTFGFAELAQGDEVCEGHFYCIGTVFARSLFETMTVLGLDPKDPEARGQMMRQVLMALRGARALLEANAATLLPPPHGEAAKCEPRESLELVYDGQVASAFFFSMLTGLEQPARVALCNRLIANFGDQGFTAAAREACQP